MYQKKYMSKYALLWTAMATLMPNFLKSGNYVHGDGRKRHPLKCGNCGGMFYDVKGAKHSCGGLGKWIKD